MSSRGLEEVISELRDRGLKAGQTKADKIIAAAEAQSEERISAAKAEAESIVQAAREQAEATKRQLDAELRQAAAVGLEAFRQQVQAMFLAPTVNDALRDALSSPDFLQNLILEIIGGFTQAGLTEGDLHVTLAEDQREQLEEAFIEALRERAESGVEVRFEDGFEFGFRLAPSEGGYLFDFSDEGFREIFLRFLAPRFRRYFFAED